MNSRGVVSEEKLPNIAEISKSRNLINKNTKCTSKNINGGNVKASQLKFRLPHIPQYGKSRNEFQCNAGNPRWR